MHHLYPLPLGVFRIRTLEGSLSTYIAAWILIHGYCSLHGQLRSSWDPNRLKHLKFHSGDWSRALGLMHLLEWIKARTCLNNFPHHSLGLFHEVKLALTGKANKFRTMQHACNRPLPSNIFPGHFCFTSLRISHEMSKNDISQLSHLLLCLQFRRESQPIPVHAWNCMYRRQQARQPSLSTAKRHHCHLCSRRFVDPRMHILRIIIKVVLLPRCLSVPWEHSSRHSPYAQIDKQWPEGKPCWSKLQVASTFMSWCFK